MDDVIRIFVNLMLSSDVSLVELIGILSQSCPSQVKFHEWRTEEDSSFLSYSTLVHLGSKTFFQKDHTQELATRMACSDAYVWLLDAAKEALPPQMSKANQSDNILKRSRSRANSVVLSPFEPQELCQNENNGFILNGGNGRCYSETDFTSTVGSLSGVDNISTIDEPKLTTHDSKWIHLINNFNSVYDPKNSAISTIQKTISKDLAIFEFDTQYDFTLKTFVTKVTNENLGTFTGKGSSEASSKTNAMISLFEDLRKISGLFSSFKSIYPSGIESCLGQMKLFLSLNRDLITVHGWSNSGMLYQASIILSKLKNFNAVANNQEEAQKAAYIQMVKYMQLYSERIIQRKFVSNDNRSQRYGRKGGAFPRNCQGFQRPRGQKVPELTLSMCNKLVDLVADFNQFYDPRKVEESMNMLLDRNKEYFEISRSKTRDRHGNKQYDTLIKFISATFNGIAASKTDSRMRAITAVRNRLLGFSELFVYFRKQYYPQIVIHPFKVQIFTHHGEVLKLKTRQCGIYFKTIISLIHFGDFHGESENSEDAEEIAFKKFVGYMLVLIERLPKTKHEIEMEQRQIAIRNRNGVANVKNNQESKVPPNSNEFVNRTLTKSVYNPKVDEKLSKLAKLVNNYNKVVTTGTSSENAVQKLKQMSSCINYETTQNTPNLYITTVNFIGIGFFYSSQDSQQKSEHEAASKAMEFVQSLNSLWMEFDEVHKNPLFSPLEIMEHLMFNNNIIKWSTSVVKQKDESNRRTRYHSILILTNMSSFDRIDDTEMDAMKAVAEQCVAFLFNLKQAIHLN